MLAIHTETGAFAPHWIDYCAAHGIPYKAVNCFSSDIIHELRGCSALMWHWEHNDVHAALFARSLIGAVERMGLRVYPDTNTCAHFDDKLAQKYLLEAIDAPLVPAHVFYDRKRALAWLKGARFPLVWKLRGGAGSQNVRLVARLATAERLLRRSFGRGWKPDRLYALKERIRQFRAAPGGASLVNIGRGLVRALVPHAKHRQRPVERGYVYFQDFAADNICDLRILVIGHRAVGLRRMVRPGDFRASGSGLLDHDPGQIPADCLRIAFSVARAMRAQSCAFDFVRHDGQWKIIEISYAFAPLYKDCPGWWDADLTLHREPVRPEVFIIEDLLRALRGEGRRDA